MITTLRSTAPLWLALCLVAQDGTKGKARSPAEAEYDRIVTEYDAAQAAYSKAIKQAQATEAYKTAAEALKKETATLTELRKNKQTDSDEFKQATAASAELRTTMQEITKKVPRPENAVFGKKALEAAEKYAGKDDAVPFLEFALSKSGDKELTIKAVDTLTEKHSKSPMMLDIVENPPRAAVQLVGKEKALALLDKVAAENPNDLAKSWALYTKATMFAGRNTSSEEKAAADKMIAEAQKLAGSNTEITDRLNAPAFERERLQIGMEVPDIEGVDLDGKNFKLSDYRGKVVVLDFWGFW